MLNFLIKLLIAFVNISQVNFIYVLENNTEFSSIYLVSDNYICLIVSQEPFATPQLTPDQLRAYLSHHIHFFIDYIKIPSEEVEISFTAALFPLLGENGEIIASHGGIIYFCFDNTSFPLGLHLLSIEIDVPEGGKLKFEWYIIIIKPTK